MRPRAYCALFLGLLLLSVVRADEHDDDGDKQQQGVVKVQGPIESIDAAANTVKVLGLTIDISKITSTNDGTGSGSGGSTVNVNVNVNVTVNSSSRETGTGTPSTAQLAVGQVVEITLASNTPPFVATALTVKTGYEEQVKITAPLEAIDASGKTIKLLGLTIDVSNATLESAGKDGQTTPITYSDLRIGQFVTVVLDRARLPELVALSLDVNRQCNSVDIDVDDDDENDGEDGGNQIDVDVEIMVKIAITGPDGKQTTVTKEIHMHFTISSGKKVELSGLPDGKANVTLTKADGSRAQKKLSVKGNRVHKLKVKFKKQHHKSPRHD